MRPGLLIDRQEGSHARRWALLFCLMLAAATGCTASDRAQQVVDRAIERHGSALLARAEVTFTFRDDRYEVRHFDGRFEYVRTYTDSTGARVRDELTNEGAYREIEGEAVSLDEDETYALETNVNSVVYFALLPYKLNDPAVQKRYLGEVDVRGEPYHKVEVTFQKEGGGRDHDDRFVYWFHRERDTMDYLAYYFHTEEGGSRFRVATAPREVEGVRFQDYLNYAAEPDTLEIDQIQHYDELLEAGGVELVSEVRKEDITVQPLSSF